jgi:putative addiction module component (TIGR02574 family)
VVLNFECEWRRFYPGARPLMIAKVKAYGFSHNTGDRHNITIHGQQGILSQLLKLPASERARLAAELVHSLDESEDPEAAQEWLLELDRRAQKIVAGTAKLEEWEEVRRRIASRLRARRIDNTASLRSKS